MEIDRELAETLVLDVAFILREADKPATPEDVAGHLLKILYIDANSSWDELVVRGGQILEVAREVLT